MSDNAKTMWKTFGLICACTVVAFFLMIAIGGIGPCGPSNVFGLFAMIATMIGALGSVVIFFIALIMTFVRPVKKNSQSSPQVD